MLTQLGLLAGCGLVASLAALAWIQPDTAGGQALLGTVVFAIVTGAGKLLWPKLAGGESAGHHGGTARGEQK